MNAEELAFANQQLAGMLKSGIPLEGALKQLCLDMKSGTLRAELLALEKDLSQGTPLKAALEQRDLPALYKTMFIVGQVSEDLPATLLLVADHYQKSNALQLRLRTILVYPVIVLGISVAVSVLLSMLLLGVIGDWQSIPGLMISDESFNSSHLSFLLVASPAVLSLLFVFVCIGLLVPQWRRWLQWRLPGFREASVAQHAEMFHLLLSRHYPLRDALQLMTLLAPGASVRSELKEWGARLALGATRFDQMAQGGRVFPPLFVWLVSSAGEDLSEGFGRAASIYYSRAHHKIEMALYVLLPICTLTLGLLVLGQTYPVLTMIGRQVGMLGS